MEQQRTVPGLKGTEHLSKCNIEVRKEDVNNSRMKGLQLQNEIIGGDLRINHRENLQGHGSAYKVCTKFRADPTDHDST
ncbi:unnamed protein product [Acanthoscelides obtectus]|uniref:Uncharacterized protein n=1 Tax=Acanthoscelides obtectus TaxID=200917 RepID=A0A9P0P5P2_ACAOB|nr:unnamed protein product [Acanthoscelides obtectus]CAK1633472.1 hypothetical protein AOBTE_LOCUS8160 [Acanthoscelides obtectus]